MSDAIAAARARIDRALSALERKIKDVKTRAASAAPGDDDDLFAIPSATTPAADPALRRRVQELEAAGRDASEALAGAIEQLRDLVEAPTPVHPTLEEED